MTTNTSHPHSNNVGRAPLRPARIVYFAVWAIAALVALGCEAGLLPAGCVSADAQTAYGLHMLCVVLTLAAIPGALKLFAVQERKGTLPLLPMHMLRTGLMAVPIFVDLIVYYALLSSSIPLYCLLISLLAFVFCFPQQTGR